MVERDRFGDKLKEKERADEDRYFAERDRALLERIRERGEEGREAAIAELAVGRCPKCGQRLTARTVDDVSVERCPRGHGIWLAEGEMGSLGRRESEGWLARFFRQTLEGVR